MSSDMNMTTMDHSGHHGGHMTTTMDHGGHHGGHMTTTLDHSNMDHGNMDHGSMGSDVSDRVKAFCNASID